MKTKDLRSLPDPFITFRSMNHVRTQCSLQLVFIYKSDFHTDYSFSLMLSFPPNGRLLLQLAAFLMLDFYVLLLFSFPLADLAFASESFHEAAPRMVVLQTET